MIHRIPVLMTLAGCSLFWLNPLAGQEPDSFDSPTASTSGQPSNRLIVRGLSTLGGGSAPQSPRLYDNTTKCTPNVHAAAFGGHIFNPLSPRDWFDSPGGELSGFDVYLVNAEDMPTHFILTFYLDTDERAFGKLIDQAIFRTAGAPMLTKIEPWLDPNTGNPGVIRVSVDYQSQTYNLVGLYEDPPGSGNIVEEQINPLDQSLGETFGRRPIVLPSGKVGVQIRLPSVPNICNSEEPQAGVVLARGGTGNANGLHIIGADSPACSIGEYSLLCDNPGWRPLEYTGVSCFTDTECEDLFGLGTTCDMTFTSECVVSQPCTGRDACTFDEPYFGIALTLYTGSNEDTDGNNEIATADPISVGFPAPCATETLKISGFLGDNGTPIGPGTPLDLFDADRDGDVDLLDWRDFQRCVGRDGDATCLVHDQDRSGRVEIADYGDDGLGFFGCVSGDVSAPGFTSPGPECEGETPPAPVLLQDVDFYQFAPVPGSVLSVHVEGAKNSDGVSLWNPQVRVFRSVGGPAAELGGSDDFERFSRDAFTTIQLPPSFVPIYVGVSSAANSDYDPLDPETIGILDVDEGGGYTLSVLMTMPDCVEDDQSGADDECYVSKHEPDDTLADADAWGETTGAFIRGMIGDGAFAASGQDVDIYRIHLSGALANARSLTARVTSDDKTGFATVFDLALALYDSTGSLIACGDQAATPIFNGRDESRPQLAANVDGTGVGGDGVFYLAVFGTDRGLFGVSENLLTPAVPPSILSIPDATGLPGVPNSDPGPFVGGRVNLPGPMLSGPPLLQWPLSGPTFQQCYDLLVLPSMNRLGTVGLDDVDELASPEGNDSIPFASESVTPSDRLSVSPVAARSLGNGPFGGWQGDVDFYRIEAQPGQIAVVNTADLEQPPQTEHSVRAYLALLDSSGNVFADHDYSHEHFFILPGVSNDGTANEIAATVAGVVPANSDGVIYAMVAIDNGSLQPRENLPYDLFRSGTTYSRRFQSKVGTARRYGITVSLIDPVQSPIETSRAFAVTRRGLDEQHTAPAVSDLEQSTSERFPPIVEIEPNTGRIINVLDAQGLFTFRAFQGSCLSSYGCPPVVSANPVIAYDGDVLWVSVERCILGPTSFCQSIERPLFRIDPDLSSGQAGFVVEFDPIANIPSDAVLTGMVEFNGYLFALDSEDNRFRFWPVPTDPVAVSSTQSVVLTSLSGTDPGNTSFTDLDGDIATDDERLYVGCTLGDGGSAICVFSAVVAPDGMTVAMEFHGTIADPISNLGLTPGPRLGGLEIVGDGVLMTTDRNGPIIEFLELATDQVSGVELPRGYVIERLTAR